MASTIKLKTGTGSAVPSALAQGEIGINIDNGLIYYGSGSGNHVKKLENFAYITASNDISASGIITALSMSGDGSTLTNITATTPAGTISSSGQLPSGIISSSGQLPSGTVSSSGQLPSGIISSSGQLPSGTVSSSGQLPSGIISSSTQPFTNITASGDISASGKLYATLGTGTDNSVVVNSSGQLVTDEIDAGVWGGAGELVTTEGDKVAPFAAQLNTVRTNTNSEFYPTLVDSVNSSATAETFYTPTSGLTFNPSENLLTVTSASTTGINVTRTGNISGSEGNILGFTTSSVLNLKTTDNIDVGNDLYVDQIRRHSDSSTTTKLNLGDEVFKIYTGHASNEVVNVQLDRLSINTNITASGDISGSAGKIEGFATASIAGPIRGKQLQVYHANWKDNAGTTETFVPLAGVPDEQTSGVKEQQAIIMPCAGTIKEVILRMHWTSTITTSDDITWRIYTRDKLKKMNGTDLLSSFTMTNPTQGASNANNTRTSGVLNQTFDTGDAIMISMQWASTGPTHTADRIYVTVVVEYDWETVTY